METGRRWFVLENNQVNGPYQTSEVEALMPNAKNPLIWGRGLNEWLPPQDWIQALKDPAINTQASSDEPEWRYRHEGKEFGPMTFKAMMDILKSYSDFEQFVVYNEVQKEWQELYLVAKICDELGISRRVHPRVPIMASLVCETPRGAVTTKIISISEGGLGASEASQLKIGEKYKATLTSSNLYTTLNCMIEVMYVGTEGYAGLRFLNLPAESRSTIITYINKFKDLRK